jgi:hypothetical protein
MRRASVALGICGALGCTLLACGAIIGTRDDLTYDPDAAGGGGGTDAVANADGTGGGNTDANAGKDAGSGDGASSDGAATCPGVDLTNDDKNCGACNHDCLGGKCMTSKCQPAKLFSGGIATYALAVDSTNILFIEM